MEKQLAKKMSANQLNWLIDVVAFTLFFLVAAPQSTGIPLHEWLSYVFFATFIVHIAVHWQWIVDISKRLLASNRLLKKLPGETRFNYFFNLLSYFMMILAIVSGTLISEAVLPALGIQVVIDPFWTTLHRFSGNLSLFLLAVHLPCTGARLSTHFTAMFCANRLPAKQNMQSTSYRY